MPRPESRWGLLRLPTVRRFAVHSAHRHADRDAALPKRRFTETLGRVVQTTELIVLADLLLKGVYILYGTTSDPDACASPRFRNRMKTLVWKTCVM